jgi:putative peptidoglycan lipid II flippase
MVALGPALGTPSVRYAALAALVALGGVSYFGTGLLIGAFRMAEFRSLLRRQR